MAVYTTMKDSGIDWIGSVPSHWAMHTLYQLVAQVKNKNKDLSEKNLLSLSYGKIKRKNIETTEGLLPESFDGYNIIEDGDVVLRLTDLQNDHTSLRVGLVTERGIITSAYTTLRPSEECISKYMYYLLHTFDIRKGFYGMGSGVRQGLNYDEVKELRVILPTVDEQKAIAAYLDEQCTLIDGAIEEAKASIEEYTALRASVIYEVITKGIDNHAQLVDSRIPWIGHIPESWSVCAIKHCTSKIGSGKTPSGGAEVYTDEGVMFLRSQNIYNSGLMIEDVSYISEKIDSEMQNTRVRYRDVLLNITGGSIGRCCIFDLDNTPANVNQHVCILRTIPQKMLPEYLRYFWNSACGSMVVAQFQTGGNRAGLNFEQIGNIKIPLCSIDEQRRIVDYLDVRCSTVDEIIEAKNALIAEFESYKRSLIYEVVTGKRKVVQ